MRMDGTSPRQAHYREGRPVVKSAKHSVLAVVGQTPNLYLGIRGPSGRYIFQHESVVEDGHLTWSFHYSQLSKIYTLLWRPPLLHSTSTYFIYLYQLSVHQSHPCLSPTTISPQGAPLTPTLTRLSPPMISPTRMSGLLLRIPMRPPLQPPLLPPKAVSTPPLGAPHPPPSHIPSLRSQRCITARGTSWMLMRPMSPIWTSNTAPLCGPPLAGRPPRYRGGRGRPSRAGR